MSAGKQTFAQNPCHFWWKLNPASSSVYLQGLFTHSPEVGDSSLDEVSSTFQTPKLEDGGIRAAPSPSSLCILCCGTTGTDCSMDSKIPHEGRRITAPDPTAVHCKNPVIIPAVLSFLIWKAFKKSQFESPSALLSLLYRMWSLSLPTEQEPLSGPTLHMKSEIISRISQLALFFISIFFSV